MSELAVALLVLAALGTLAWLQYRAMLERRQERLEYVAPVLPLLEAAKVEATADFPVLTGRYAGHDVRIEPHTDTMAVRKLPSLWLLVTMRTPLPVTASLDVMMRPRNVEYWSPFDRFSVDLERPAHWPEQAVARTDQAAAAGGMRRLIEPHLDFLRDPRGKEILITPNGVRFTWLAEEGERGAYLLMRQAKFAGEALDAGLVRGLLERCRSVVEAAAAGAGAEQQQS